MSILATATRSILSVASPWRNVSCIKEEKNCI